MFKLCRLCDEDQREGSSTPGKKGFGRGRGQVPNEESCAQHLDASVGAGVVLSQHDRAIESLGKLSLDQL